MMQLHHRLHLMALIGGKLKNGIVTDIGSEAISPGIKRKLFYHLRIGFVNRLKLKNQKYQSNGNRREENYKGNFSFPTKEFFHFELIVN